MRNTLQPGQPQLRRALVQTARQSHWAVTDVVRRFVQERLIFRLSKTEYARSLSLKGAVLLPAWLDKGARPTAQIDLQHGDSRLHVEPAMARQIVAAACAVPVEPADHLHFFSHGMVATEAAVAGSPRGVEVQLPLHFGRLPQVVYLRLVPPVAADVVPEPLVLPTLLAEATHATPAFAPGNLRAATLEQCLAEKVHALDAAGAPGAPPFARHQDLWDVFALAGACDISGARLSALLKLVFSRRQSQLPASHLALLPPGGELDPLLRGAWNRFLRVGHLAPVPLEEVAERLVDLLGPLLAAFGRGHGFVRQWVAGAGWQT